MPYSPTKIAILNTNRVLHVIHRNLTACYWIDVYIAGDRVSVSDAFLHPFLAPEVAARFLMPSTSKSMHISTSNYIKGRVKLPELYKQIKK